MRRTPIDDARFVEMDMALDQAGASEPSSGVICLGVGHELTFDCDDAATPDAEVHELVGCSIRDAYVPDDEIHLPAGHKGLLSTSDRMDRGGIAMPSVRCERIFGGHCRKRSPAPPPVRTPLHASCRGDRDRTEEMNSPYRAAIDRCRPGPRGTAAISLNVRCCRRPATTNIQTVPAQQHRLGL